MAKPRRFIDDEGLRKATVADQLEIITNYVRQEVAAKVVGITGRTFREKRVPALDNGRYSLPEVVRFFRDTGQFDGNKRTDTDEDSDRLLKARADKEQEAAMKLRLENLDKIREVVKISSIQDEFAVAALSIRQGMERLQDRFGPEAFKIMKEALEAAEAKIAASIGEVNLTNEQAGTIDSGEGVPEGIPVGIQSGRSGSGSDQADTSDGADCGSSEEGRHRTDESGAGMAATDNNESATNEAEESRQEEAWTPRDEGEETGRHEGSREGRRRQAGSGREASATDEEEGCQEGTEDCSGFCEEEGSEESTEDFGFGIED